MVHQESNLVVVTAGDGHYRPLIDNLIKSVERFYPILVYDLGGLGIGKKIDCETPQKNTGFKPTVLLDALKKHKFVVWMDADMELVERIDETDLDYDIAVTVRKKKEKCSTMGAINSGVVWCKSKKFCQEWEQQCKEHSEKFKFWTDQAIINKMINPEVNDVGKTITVNGYKVKLFSGSIYNKTFYDHKDFWDAPKKMIHYKTNAGKRLFKKKVYK